MDSDEDSDAGAGDQDDVEEMESVTVNGDEDNLDYDKKVSFADEESDFQRVKGAPSFHCLSQFWFKLASPNSKRFLLFFFSIQSNVKESFLSSFSDNCVSYYPVRSRNSRSRIVFKRILLRVSRRLG